LRALRKVAGYTGRNVGLIEWAGMSQNEKGSIILDPGMVLGKYPVPFHKFDYLAGLVVHEAFHRTEWSELLWKKVADFSNSLTMIQKVGFHKIVLAGEDIYVDFVSEQSILGDYTRLARRVAINHQNQSIQAQVSVDHLVVLWRQAAFEEHVPVFSKTYAKPLAALQSLTKELKKISLCSQGATKRCEARAKNYISAWNKIKDMICSWNVIDKFIKWIPCDDRKDDRRNVKREISDKQKKPVQPLSKETALDVENQLAFGSADITPVIRAVEGIDENEIVPMSRWDFNIPAQPVIDQKLVGRLRAVIQNYADRKTILNRGLVSGRVDRRNLYRSPITGRCFLYKQKMPVMDWNICLLIDASGSMRGYRWQMVENTMGTIQKAFHGLQNRLQCFAYYESEGVCIISNLINGKKLLSVPPNGRTASGQAIIAAAYFMPADMRKNFLVHITDGETNFGCDVRYGIDYCKKRGIHLLTLGVAYKDKDVMISQYGKNIQFLDNFGQLPSIAEKLLKWSLLYQGKKNLRFI